MRWGSLLILCAIAAVGAASYSILSILVESIKADLSLTDGEIGLITGLMIAIVGALAAFPVGAAADRFGRSPVLACCILTWSAATAVLAFASSKSVFALGVAGIILGEAALIPLLYAMIPAMFSDKQRPTANIVLVSVMVIGAYGVYAVLGALLQTFEDWNAIPLAPWRGVCLVVALTGAAVTAALVMTPARKENAPKVGAGDLRDQSFLTYLKREGPTLFLFYLAISLYFVAFTQGIMFWSPAILQRSYGLSAAEANIALGTPLIAASAVGLALAYWLQRKLGSRWGHAFGVRLVILACSVGIPIAALMPFAPTALAFVAAQSLLVVCMTLSMSVAPALLQDCAPDRYRSRVIALFPLVAVVVRIVIPWGIGGLSDAFSDLDKSLLYINVGSMLIALPASIWLLRSLEPRYLALAERVRREDGTTIKT